MDKETKEKLNAFQDSLTEDHQLFIEGLIAKISDYFDHYLLLKTIKKSKIIMLIGNENEFKKSIR